MTAAKDYIATVTAPVTEWTGPTTGPKAQGKKLVVYVSTDQRNGGAQGVGDGAAGGGQGARLGLPHPRRPGLGAGAHLGADPGDRAEAGRHHPRRVDAPEQAPIIEQAVAEGIKMVGWHAGPAAGPIEGVPQVVLQHHHRPARSRQGRRPLRGRRFRRQGGRHPVHRLDLRDRHRQDRRRRRPPSRSARAARCWRSRTRRSATSPTAWDSSPPRCSPSTAPTGPTRSP